MAVPSRRAQWLHTLATAIRLQRGEREIEEIMKKADKLLKPLDLGKQDIAKRLHKRIGLT